MNSDELFDMALQASQANDTQKSIGLIKDALDQSPDDARMWYMLGTLYTNIGIYDKAIANMEKALELLTTNPPELGEHVVRVYTPRFSPDLLVFELDSDYSIARFHLGLLYLMSGRREYAETTWKLLDALGEAHYLSLFKAGLLKIVNDQLQEGIDLIRRGIANNHLSESLNKDMETVVEHASLSLKEMTLNEESAERS